MLVDGALSQRLPADLRGYGLGDGLFETLAVHDGAVVAAQLHWRRLQAGCERLGLDAPSFNDFESQCQQMLAACDWPAHGWLKFQQLAAGERGYARHGSTSYSVVSAGAGRAQWPSALRLGLGELRLARQPQLAGLKHCSRLEQILLARELAQSDHYDELLACDSEGFLIESTQANVIFFTGSQALTPRLEQAGVAGVMLARVRRHLTTQGLEVLDRDIDTGIVESCDSVLLCNSLRGVCFAAELLGRTLQAPRLLAELPALSLDPYFGLEAQ